MGRASGQFAQASSPDAVSPIILLRVLDMPSITEPVTMTSAYFTDAEEIISFFDEAGDPEAYIPVGLSFDRVSVDNSTKVVSFRVRVDNVSRDFCTLASQVRIQGARLELVRAFREDLTDPEAGQALVSGLIQAWVITEGSIEVDVTAPLNLPIRTPQRLYWVRCPWEFCGLECGLEIPAGGLDVSVEANAISGGTAFLYRKEAAFDGTETLWQSSQTGTGISGAAYIGQSGLHVPVDKIRLKTAQDGYNVPSIKVQLQYDTEWVDLLEWTIPTTADTWQEVAVPDYEGYRTHSIRLLANANLASGKAWRVREIETLTLGERCDKTLEVCRSYGNANHFGGFPHILRTRNPREVWTKS